MPRRSSRAGTAQTPEDTPATEAVVGEVVPPRRQRDLDGRKVLIHVIGVITRIPRYVKLGWLLMQDPTVPARAKAALGGGLAYALSPIDPVPGFIPIFGQLDDLAALLLGIRVALRSTPDEVADRHLCEANLSRETLERDIVTIRATTVWLARRGGALAARLVRSALAAAGRKVSAMLPGRSAPEVDAPAAPAARRKA